MIELQVNSAQAVAGTQEAQTALTRLTEAEKAAQAETAALEARIAALEAQLAKLRATSSSAGSSIIKDLQAIGAPMADTAAQGEKMSSAFSSLGSAGPVGIATAVVAAQAVVVAYTVSQWEKFGETLYKFQSITGASARDASVLTGQAEILGISSESLDSAMGRLSRNIATGKDGLANYGVEIVRTKDGHVALEATLQNIAQRYAELNGTTEQAAMAQQAFGKGFMTLAPLLAQGKDGMLELEAAVDKTGKTMNQTQINQAHEFSDTMKELKATGEGLAVSLGSILGPAVTVVAKAFEQAVQPIVAVGHAISDVSGFITAHIPGLSLLTEGHKKAADSAAAHAAAIDHLLNPLDAMDVKQRKAAEDGLKLATLQEKLASDIDSGATSTQLMADKLAVLDEQAKQTAAGLADVDAEQKALTKDQDAYLKAVVDLPGAQDNLTKSLAALKDAQDGAKGSAEAAAQAAQQQADRVKEAEDTLTESRNKVGIANDKVAQAETALAKVRADTQTETNALIDAELALRQAQMDGLNSKHALTLAEEKLNQVKIAGGSPDQIAQAELGVQDAHLKVDEAAQKATESGQKLADERQFGSTHAADLQKAEDAVTQALDNQMSARDAVIRDTDSLNQARTDLVTKTNAQASAEGDLATALANVVKATEAQAKAQAALAGVTLSPADIAQLEIAQLTAVLSANPGLASQILPMIAQLSNLPTAPTTPFALPGGGTGPTGGTDKTPIKGAYQSGGVVPGSGPGLATVHGGEVVINPSEGIPPDVASVLAGAGLAGAPHGSISVDDRRVIIGELHLYTQAQDWATIQLDLQRQTNLSAY